MLSITCFLALSNSFAETMISKEMCENATSNNVIRETSGVMNLQLYSAYFVTTDRYQMMENALTDLKNETLAFCNQSKSLTQKDFVSHVEKQCFNKCATSFNSIKDPLFGENKERKSAQRGCHGLCDRLSNTLDTYFYGVSDGMNLKKSATDCGGNINSSTRSIKPNIGVDPNKLEKMIKFNMGKSR